MGNFLCKIWSGLLNLFTQVVEAVATALKVVGGAVVDVLSDIVQNVAGAFGDIFSASPLFTVGLVGLGLWWFLGKDDESKKPQVSNLGDTQWL